MRGPDLLLFIPLAVGLAQAPAPPQPPSVCSIPLVAMKPPAGVNYTILNPKPSTNAFKMDPMRAKPPAPPCQSPFVQAEPKPPAFPPQPQTAPAEPPAAPAPAPPSDAK